MNKRNFPFLNTRFGAVLWLVVSAMCTASCGGSESGIQSRFVAVHNAMSAVGMAQTGAMSEGSLAEGAEARLPMRLEAGQCYTLVGFGAAETRDLNLRVVEEGGGELARDSTRDKNAAVKVCPERSANYQVIVSMAEGYGSYMVTSWSSSGHGDGSSGGPAIASIGGRGGCAEPLPVEFGRTIRGETRRGESKMQGSCAGGDAAEVIYRLVVRQRSQLSASLVSSFDGALYVQRSCGDAQTEVACNDDGPSTSRSQLDVALDPGTYFLVVDGYGNEAGTYELQVTTSNLPSVSAVCGDATVLTPGQPVSGTTQGAADHFQASCAQGARSADRLYRVDVAQRSRLRIRQETEYDGALYLRRSCSEATSEVMCSDDFGDYRHSLITAVVDPGQYYVYTDGFGQGHAGQYTISADLVADSGGTVAGDNCSNAVQANAGEPIQPDTLEAHDDLSGSCGGQGSPDVVYRLDVRGRVRLRAQVSEAELEGAIYVQRRCGESSSEVACANFPQGGQGTLDTALERGTYYLVLDGRRADAFGSAKVVLQVDDIAALERTCREAPLLRPGQSTQGTTLNGSDRFQASCASGAQSNDVIYRLQLRQRSRVRINMSSDYDGVLHLRRACADKATELACNDDQGDNRHSQIETTLDAGMYYVIVDGLASGNNGTYTVDVDVSKP